ncbi:Anti-sigma regulatory factor (Ser/Thr protein kinase) [Nonomuraea solani]|uniref:Anti-sigma regulatory factor (Ser/Thr protein kinase) n=1 Tax=Nonomuraea solani TaxID=1144553 RepID=A0A1H6EKF4_9ACTN|nr:ATP-binding protein [Nonomuraea solani]SEG98332.1 Anti-sigma regulatory factor (Ser/Thr protein kinase) [Nonomuraea solani]
MRTFLTQPFALDDVTKLRRAVAEAAEHCGLHGPRLDDFVLAVHESVVNAVEHAGGHGHFRLWTVDGIIRSETTDEGSGIPPAYVNGASRPSDQSYTGRGIYLIRRLCDAADFRTGPGGTTVRLTMRLPRGHDHGVPRAMRRIRVSSSGGHPFGRFTA